MFLDVRQGTRPTLMLLMTLVAVATSYWLLQSRLAMGASYWHIFAPYPLERERFGVGGSAGTISEAQWQTLGAGWYVPFGTILDPGHPNAVAVLQTIRIQGETAVLDDGTLADLIRANPASVWRIGNEPDSPWQDNATPEQYARAYHRLYHFVKAEDPQAQVAFGGLVQATPLRLLYLDFVWAAYQDLYGEPMPVDVWTLHSYILPETVSGWGAGIPAGMGAYAYRGIRYEIRDHDNMTIFGQRFRDFRQWMADHGQRDKPLLVPEFGCLMWPVILDEDGEDFSDDRVIAFMYATFDFFLTATDPDSGYAADGNRLVQAWAWFSLDDDVYADGQKIGEGYGGDLFTGASSKTITALGVAYAAYVQALGDEEYADLWPLRLEADLGGALWGQTGVVTMTAEIANHGRQPAQAVPVQFWDGDPDAGGRAVGAPQSVPQVPGRYEGTGTASVTWTTLVSGTRSVWLVLDPGDMVLESDDTNNRAAFAVDLTADVYPGSLRFDPPAPVWQGQALTVSASAEVFNAGPVGVSAGIEVWFWVGEPGVGEAVEGLVPGPLAAGEGVEVTAELVFDAAGLHTVTVQVDAAGAVVESDEGDNGLSATLLVATQRLFLPLLLRDWR